MVMVIANGKIAVPDAKITTATDTNNVVIEVTMVRERVVLMPASIFSVSVAPRRVFISSWIRSPR
jgi:hypothetical protein